MASEISIEQAVAKIIRRYEADVPEVKQFLRPGEDRILLALISSLVAERDASERLYLDQMEANCEILNEKETAERLLAEARAALKPFAEIAEEVAALHPGWDHDGFQISRGMSFAPFRKARAALSEGEP